MIRIEFPEKDSDLEDWYKKKVKTLFKKEKKISEYEKNIKTLESILNKYGVSYSFEQILTLKYNELKDIKEKIKDDSNFIT